MGKVKVTMKQIRARLWALTKAYVVDESVDMDLENSDNDNEKLSFAIWASWGFNSHCRITAKDEEFDLSQKNLKFIVHWKDMKEYKLEWYTKETRKRDVTAPT